jgi:hypothetical protein
LMYDTAALTSGFTLEEPADLAAKIHKMLYNSKFFTFVLY